MTWWAIRKHPRAIAAYGADSLLPLPDFAGVASVPLVAPLEWRMNKVSDTSTERDLRELPAHLDKVDAWIAEGTLGGESANGADLQIGSSMALLSTHTDLAPMTDGRPALELGRRHFAGFPGSTPAGTFPSGWVNTGQ